MELDLSKQDLISLAKGTKPNYRVMDIPLIKDHGSMGGPHGDQWSWKWNAFESESDEIIYEIYLICKKSWEEETDEEIKERLRKRYSDSYPDNPSKISVAHIMAVEFPNVTYHIMRDVEEPYLYNMKVEYNDPKEIEKAILDKVPASFGITVEEF